MSNGENGILVLKEAPTGEVEEKVVNFLIRFSKKGTIEQLRKKVKNTPFILSKDIPAEKAQLIVEALQKMGASTSFVPHTPSIAPSPEENTTFDSSDLYVPEPPRRLKEKRFSGKPDPKKNGARQRMMILTIILLILSLGFLAWQIYPFVVKKLQTLGIG
jgi:hypothetical protein